MPLLDVLIGGALTFLGGTGGSYILQRNQRLSESRSLASAFAGEIGAIISLVDKRDYVGALRKTIEQNQNNQKNIFYFPIRKNYFNVFERNVEKIGLLKTPLPEKIVTFYTQMFAILEDIETEQNINITETPIQTLTENHQGLLDLALDTLAIGKDVLSLLRHEKRKESTSSE